MFICTSWHQNICAQTLKKSEHSKIPFKHRRNGTLKSFACKTSGRSKTNKKLLNKHDKINNSIPVRY